MPALRGHLGELGLRYDMLCAAYRLHRTGDLYGALSVTETNTLCAAYRLQRTVDGMEREVSQMYTHYVLHIACSGREMERAGGMPTYFFFERFSRCSYQELPCGKYMER